MQPKVRFDIDVRAPRTHGYVPFVLLMATSLFVLDGCEVVKGIFNVGAWFGALMVIMVLMIVGGVAAMFMRSQ